MPKGIKANDKEYGNTEEVSIGEMAGFSNRKRALRERKTGQHDNSSKQ